MMQVIMIAMELTRAGCPNVFIGTPESVAEAYSETGKTKPSWPSPNEPADVGTQLLAE
jgi:hypothetical protein